MSKKKSKAQRKSSLAKHSDANVSLIKAEFKGPIPPPDLFSAYEEVLPGSADRILKMAENEQKQQHKVQNKIIKANVTAEKLGMIFGFSFQVIVVTGLFVLGGVLLLADKDMAGYVSLITAAAGSGILVYRQTHLNGEQESESPTKK